MRRVLVLILLFVASLSVACGVNNVSSSKPKTGATKETTASSVENPKRVLGDTATTTEDGNTLTVLSYESPLTVKGANPKTGFEFSAIEVEGCASASSGRDLMHIGSTAFTLRLSDEIPSVHPVVFDDVDATVKEPALRTMDPPPGRCNRSFVTFQTPQGERPKFVVFEEEFVSEMPVIAWSVPKEQ